MRRIQTFLLSIGFFLFAGSFLSPLPAQDARFRRGDSNADSRIDLSDAIHMLMGLFMGGEQPSCQDASDFNDDGALDISDPLATLGYLFTNGSAPAAPGEQCGSDLTPDALGCTSNGICGRAPVLGQTDFETRSPSGPPGPVALDGRESDDAAAGVPPAPAADPGATPAPERLIEESDIYKIDGDFLFVMNRYRGLQVIDLANLDRPKVLGRAPIFGYPKEMYVRENRAYILVSDYYSFWRDPLAEDSISPVAFHGSQIRILDISDVENPAVIGGIDIEGDLTDSRIVGDIMYVASQRYSWWWNPDSDDQVDETHILAVDIGDPADVKVVDRKEFPRNGWEHHIAVDEDTIYLASSGVENNDWRNGYRTKITYIDISDPAGTVAVRGTAVAPGRVQDRWSMDEFDGVLRVASGQSWGNGDVYLTTYSVRDPDLISRLGQYVLHVNERLTAARFDGPRGYLVSYRNIDPLFTFDLSNPAAPKLLGELEMSGWLDFIVPMGDRLVSLGHEDIVRPEGGRDISLAVSLIDVSLQTKPALLSRVSLDGIWGWVPGDRDDFAKVFKVLDAEGLIVFPFQAWSRTDYRYIGGVQLIDLFDQKLARRGLIRDAGWVERGIPHEEATVLTLSSEIFQVMDIRDRDNPRLRGRLELARNVQEFAPLSDAVAVQLSGDWWRGDTTLTVTPIGDPDSADPLAQVHVPAPYGRMFVNGAMTYVASIREEKAADGSVRQVSHVQVVDLSDPVNPKLRGAVSLPDPIWFGYHSWYWGWGDEAVQVNGSTLAFHRFSQSWWGCRACDVAVGPVGGDWTQAHTIYLVDLANPDAPVLASTVILKDVSWAWGLRVSGSTLYLSSYASQWVDNKEWVTRYHLHRLGVADPANPVVMPAVNIPGMFIDASPDGQYLYTQESTWDQTTQKNRTFFYSLALIDDQAHLQSKTELPGYANGALVKGDSAYASTTWWEVVPLANGQGSRWVNHSELLTVDLSDPQAIKLAGRAKVPFDYAYLQEVDGGRAFLGSWVGVFTYRVEDLYQPSFEQFFRTQGWVQDIVVKGKNAYLPTGYYGVQILELGE